MAGNFRLCGSPSNKLDRSNTAGLPTIHSVGPARACGVRAGLVEFFQRFGI